MGNRVTNTLDKWGLNPRKLSLKRSTRKAPPVVSRHQSLDPHIYDNVPVEPEYARVRKKKRRTATTAAMDSDGLHYAEIQVLQSESAGAQKTPPAKNTSTEYATIDFLRGAKPKESAEPADLFIPPGELQGLMVKSRSKKRASSHRAVMV